MEDYWGKSKELLLNTSAFLKSVSKEKEYIPILLYVLVLYMIGTVVESIAGLFTGIQPGMVFVGFLIALIFTAIAAFIFPFIVGGLVHLGVLLFKGKQGFFNTFKPMAYACSLMAIYSIFGSILGIILTLIFPDFVGMTQETMSGGMIFAMIVLAVFWVFAIVHTVYAEVIGISRYQKIPKWQAFIAVFVIPLIISIAFFMLLGFSMMSMMNVQM